MKVFANNIQLPCSEPLQLRMYNPLFNDIGSYSFPITFNARIPEVNRAFGFASVGEVVDNGNITARIETRDLVLTGTWQVTRSSDNKIEAYFKAGAGEFYSAVGDLTLPEVDYGGVKYPVGQFPAAGAVFGHLNTKMSAYFPNNEYAAFCAYTPNAYGEDTTDDQKIVNEINPDMGTNPTFKEKANGNDTVYLFTGAVIEYIFRMFGYKIIRNVFREDYDLQRHVIFNAYNKRNESKFDYSDLVPKVKVVEFLKAVRQSLGIGFFINESIKEVTIIGFDQIIVSTVIQLPNRIVSRNFDRRRTPGFSFGTNPPDDYSSSDYNSGEDFADADVTTVDLKSEILPSILNHGKIYYVTSESSFYIVTKEDSVYVANRLTTDLLPYGIGSGSIEIDQIAGVVTTGTWSRIYPEVPDPEPPGPPLSLETEVIYTLPRYDGEVGNSTSPDVPFPLMFCIARGIQPAYVVPNGNPFVTEESYPLGSYDVYDALGDKISTANLSLKWTGEYGLIQKLWKNRVFWEMHRKQTSILILSSEGVDQLIDYTSPKRIGLNNYLVNRLDMEVGQKRVIIKEAEMFRL